MSGRTETKGIEDFLVDAVRGLPVIGACMYAKEDMIGGERHWHEQAERMEQAGDRPYFSKWQKAIAAGFLTAMAAGSLAFYAILAYRSNMPGIKWNKSVTISQEQNRVHFWFFEDGGKIENLYCVEIDISGKEPRLVRVTQSSTENLRRIGDILDKGVKDTTRTSKKRVEAGDAKYGYILEELRKMTKEKPELKAYAPAWILEKGN